MNWAYRATRTDGLCQSMAVAKRAIQVVRRLTVPGCHGLSLAGLIKKASGDAEAFGVALCLVPVGERVGEVVDEHGPFFPGEDFLWCQFAVFQRNVAFSHSQGHVA